MKIRTITFFYLFKELAFDDRFLSFLSNAKHIEESFKERGMPAQTVRLTTNISDFLRNERDIRESLILEDVCEDFKITFVNYGKFNSNINLLPSLFDNTKNVSASTEIKCSPVIDFNMLDKASSAVLEISNLGKNKNFNYCVSMNIKEHTPFYPASYASKEGFSLGFENGDILQKSFLKAKNFRTAGENLTKLLNSNYEFAEKTAESLSKIHKTAYLGIDTSFAPGLGRGDSVMRGFDILKNKTHADYLSIAGLVTDSAKSVNVKRVGYCGLMLPVCEDISLAEKCDKDEMTIERILLLSTVCGCGLDTIPVSGKIGRERVRAILLDTATLSRKLQKPLSVRLLPMKGLNKKAKTNFRSQYLVDCKIME